MELDFMPAEGEYSPEIDLFPDKGTMADTDLNFITKAKPVSHLLG